METTARARWRSRAAAAAGLLAPFGLAALLLLLLRSGGDRVEISTVFACVFFGFVLFDLATAIGMAVRRRRGRGASRYSSLVGLTLLFWLFWVATTGVPGSEPSGAWTANTGVALGLGAVLVAIEFLGVRRLRRVS